MTTKWKDIRRYTQEEARALAADLAAEKAAHEKAKKVLQEKAAELRATVAVLAEALQSFKYVYSEKHGGTFQNTVLANLPASARKFLEERDLAEKVVEAARAVAAGLLAPYLDAVQRYSSAVADDADYRLRDALAALDARKAKS